MSLIKTSLINSISVVVKMVTLLGLNKILAVYVGPAGYAALGQFQNAIQMLTSFASGALNTGVTKYTAEYCDDEESQKRVWRTAGTIALVVSLFMSIVIILLNRQLGRWFLHREDYGGVFVWFAATLVFFVFNTLLLAILNGKKEIGLYVVANISGSVLSLIVAGIAAINFGAYGALVGLGIYQALAFFPTLALCYRSGWFKLTHLIGSIDRRVALNLGKYVAMALTSAVVVPVSHILVRNHLGRAFGWTAVGYWEAMWRLSAAYLMVVTTTLSVYYLPRLAELRHPLEIKKEIVQGYKLILPIASGCGLVIYLLRDFIISILFTKDFAPMRDLFFWQIVGDTFKIGSWLLAYLMLGKAMTRLFVLTEIVFSIGFFVWTYAFTYFFGLRGVAVAHAANYLIYCVVMVMVLGRSVLSSKLKV